MPANPHSNLLLSPAFGSGVSPSLMGRRYRRSTNVLPGEVRTRVDVGLKGCAGRLRGFLSGRPGVYGTGVPGGRGWGRK